MVTNELNKKLAEWAGFEVLGVITNKDFLGSLWGDIDMTGFWKHPNELMARKEIDFPLSLDACFKWLVPKYIAEVCLLPMGLTSVMSIYAFLFAEWLKVMNDKVEPALALCLAIEKLIDEERKAIQ